MHIQEPTLAVVRMAYHYHSLFRGTEIARRYYKLNKLEKCMENQMYREFYNSDS